MRIAFFSPPLQGHLSPASALATALVSLGHECFLVHHPELSPDPVFRSLPIDAEQCQWTPASFVGHARSSGLPFGVLRLVRDMAAMTDSLCRTAPALLRAYGIEAVVSDQLEPAGALVARHLGLPYVSLASAHPINREPLIPLSVLPWPYVDSPQAIERNRVGAWIADKLTARHDQTVSQWSQRWGLGPLHTLGDCLSPLADISQLVRAFDFPRQHLPTSFHYVGPIRRGERPQPTASAGDGRPLIYASLGTLQNHRLPLFRRIADACRQLDVRLILSHANGLTPEQAQTIKADEVVSWVDQGEILGQCDAVITHGGLNTVLDALGAGLPTLCLPLAFEQPGIGARLARSGAGKVVSPRASTSRIAAALADVIKDPSFRQKAQALAREIDQAGGAPAAARIIHGVLTQNA